MVMLLPEKSRAPTLPRGFLFLSIACLAGLSGWPVGTLGATVLHSVTAYTSTADGIREFTAIAFSDDGRILATGSDQLRDQYPDARQIDGGGGFLLPGLTDAHGHLQGLGLRAETVDLAGARTLQETVGRVAAYADANPHLDWVIGSGWNQVLWPGREFPDAADLDTIAGERPAWLRRIDGHAGWANTKALELAGIGRDTPEPVGGRILRDRNGDPTGILVDKAMDLVDKLVPRPDRKDIRRRYRLAQAELTALGMTSVHDAGIDETEAGVLLSMAADRELALRVYAMLDGSGNTLDAFPEPIVGYGEDRLDIRAVKLFTDGALGSRGAALLEPYSDDAEVRGLAFWTPGELTALVDRANRHGFQVGIHALGDRGNRMALDALAEVQDDRPSPLRNRIEHAQLIAPDDIERFAALGVIASMQPTHATSDMNMAEDRVGPERILGGYAWRRLLDSGAVIAAGSDFPVELANPFHGLYAAVTRKSRDGQPKDGWYADQALTRAEALRAFTLDAAYAAHQEERLGSLEPGKWADFIVVDRDYFEVPASEIDDIRVLETWVGGARVHEFNGSLSQ